MNSGMYEEDIPKFTLLRRKSIGTHSLILGVLEESYD